jgi:hypothetical protein
MEMKHKILHFLLVSALWIAAAMVYTARWDAAPAKMTTVEFGGEPDFVKDAVQEFSALLMPCERP